MFLDRAIYDLLTSELERIRQEEDAAWLLDAFGMLATAKPSLVNEIIRYVTREKIRVQYDYERVQPKMPLINIGEGYARSLPQQTIGNSRRGVNLGGGHGKIEYRYEHDIRGLRLQCLASNPSQALYLWLVIQKLLIANQPELAQAFGTTEAGEPIGFYGLEITGEQQTYPVQYMGVDAFSRDVIVGAKFQDRVASRRVITQLVNSVTLDVTLNEESETRPEDEGEYS